MKTIVAAVLLSLAFPAIPAFGQAPPPAQPAQKPAMGSPAPPSSFGAPATVQGLVAYWQTRVVAVQAELDRDRTALTTSETRYKAGLTTAIEVADAQAQLARHQRELEEVMLALQSARLVAALVRPVTVELRDAPVRQVAQVLGDAGGIPVSVDAAVEKNLRLTAQAQRVPLASVLEAIGVQAHLQIDPDRGGVSLRPWPSLAVQSGPPGFGGGFGGGGGADFALPSAPWGPEWGPLLSDWVLRYIGPGPALPGLRALVPAPVPPVQLQQEVAPPQPTGLPPTGLSPPGGGLTLMPLGDRSFVLAEPGKGPQGEVGVWLTVYQVGGRGLYQLGRTFHRTSAGVGAPARTVPTPSTRPRRKGEGPTVPLPAGPYTEAPGLPAPAPPTPTLPTPPAPTGEKPLADAVREFNQRAAADPIGEDQPPLTVEEVVAAIGFVTTKPTDLPVSDVELQAARRVAETRRLPPGAGLEVMTGFQPDGAHEYTAWSVRLVMPRGTGGGTYGFPIREQWIAARAFGPHELAVKHKWDEYWRKQGGIASFDRMKYADEIAKARQEDRASSRPPAGE